MRIYKTYGRGSKAVAALLTGLERRGSSSLDAVLPAVSRILNGVRGRGDAAVAAYALKFDRLEKGQSLLVTQDETETAWRQLDPALKNSLKLASSNIRAFATRQLPQSFSFSPVSGLTTGQCVRPLESVGCYVPGGRHPLPSTMLMTVIPAQVAGVRRIVVTSPRPAAETLATAHMLGIDEFYRLGGAHAVGAMAYGTESIEKVSKIVGPGNSYVTAAKRLIASDPSAACTIDMLAGPTEIVVTSDSGFAPNIASDLVAQAEHDPEALAIFITTNAPLAVAVLAESRLRARANLVARAALRNNGYIFLAADKEEARAITNRLAPEHLTVDSMADLKWIQSAGSVFIGNDSAQPMGDYVSGPNHTLPTGGMARFRGGLSVMDFIKFITVQRYGRVGLAKLGPSAMRLAEAEGLSGHVEAVRTRLNRRTDSKAMKARSAIARKGAV